MRECAFGKNRVVVVEEFARQVGCAAADLAETAEVVTVVVVGSFAHGYHARRDVGCVGNPTPGAAVGKGLTCYGSQHLNRYDVITIGGGAAGLVTSAGAAGLGARVALIEHKRLGGECLWTGCVPSKALIAAARAAAAVRDAGRFGIRTSAPEVDFAAVMNWVRSAQATIEPHDSPERFRSLGVEVMQGTAHFVAPGRIHVDGREISGRHIVIATGSRPAVPRIEGLDQVPYHTNETIFGIEQQPASMIVLGGGPVGVELAQAFVMLGTRVTIVEAAPRILLHEDEELSARLHQRLTDAGITILTGSRVLRVANADGRVQLDTDTAGPIDAELLLVATGRVANLETLDVEAGGVVVRDGALLLDDRLRTTAPNTWAAGDVTGAPRFTHVADYQARLVLRNALFPFTSRARYDHIPAVTFTDPEIAHVGLTEQEARNRHGNRVRVWSREYAELDRAVADGRRFGMVKLVANANGRLLGAHVLGAGADNLIAELTLALRHGITLDRIANTSHAYPTYAEAVRQAAEKHVHARFTGLAKKLVQRIVRRVA